MKLSHLATAAAAVALLGGAAYAQEPVNPSPNPPAESTPPAPAADQPTTSTTTSPAGTTTTTTTTTAPAATASGQNVSVTTMTITNGPIPDTVENRAKYGQPLSRAGKRTAARGN